mmetsp:Transcript_72365/g.182552  ORF Transcript_72365/g.182552 Transcript_72365/m.182552 type:complete len:114 (+) Transcript_72365:89-430(+)
MTSSIVTGSAVNQAVDVSSLQQRRRNFTQQRLCVESGPWESPALLNETLEALRLGNWPPTGGPEPFVNSLAFFSLKGGPEPRPYKARGSEAILQSPNKLSGSSGMPVSPLGGS